MSAGRSASCTRWRGRRHGEKSDTTGRQEDRDPQARGGEAQEHPDRRVPVRHPEGGGGAAARRLRAAQPRSRPAARLARQGPAGLERPRHPGAAALHPGEGPSQGVDRRPAAPDTREAPGDGRGHSGPLRGLQRYSRGRGQDGVLPARPELVEPDDSRRLAPGDGKPGRARRPARQGPVHLHRPTLRHQFNSNFQWSTTSRDVKDGNTAHITREPEQVKAFRDTWRDGIHSYLTYLRDRLTVARELLTESGSIFIQIGDENVHRVRALMDEVFGEQNFVALIGVSKTSGLQSGTSLPHVLDFVLQYSRTLGAQSSGRSSSTSVPKLNPFQNTSTFRTWTLKFVL